MIFDAQVKNLRPFQKYRADLDTCERDVLISAPLTPAPIKSSHH